MSLKFYFHPLSSFCHKALIALYENDVAFEPVVVNLGDPKSRAEFQAVWPMAKFPVLRDEARNATVAESTTIIEYLDAHYPGGTRFVPSDADAAWKIRMWDRVYDHYVHVPMQKIVGDSLRPADKTDPYGVEQAASLIRQSYDMIQRTMETQRWAAGDAFSLADCAAAPALFYAGTVVPFGPSHRHLAGYFDRLLSRPSYARVLDEAEPYFSMFPMKNKLENPRRKQDGRTSS
jgi:glutathione S-transferase